MSFSNLEIIRFLDYEILPTDVYIKLSEDKWVKVCKKWDGAGQELFDHYKAKGVKVLFVKSDDLCFWENSTDNFQFSVREGLKSVEKFNKIVGQLGVNPEVVKMSNKIMNNNMDFLKKKEKTLFDIVNEMIQCKNYLFEKSLLVTYIGSSMLDNLKWKTDQIYEKIHFAALLHDSCLKSVKLQHIEDYDFSELSRIETKEVGEHLFKAVEIVKQSSHIPPDVESLILNHHERPDGSGFPRGVGADSLNKMNLLFNMSVQFASMIHNDWPDLNVLMQDIRLINKMYSYSKNDEILEAFNSVFESMIKMGGGL